MAKHVSRGARRTEDEFYETMPVQAAPSNGVRRITTDQYDRLSGEDMAISAVTYIVGVIEVLLAVRLVLRLFGSVAAVPLVSFIYAITRPLIAPFANVFGVNTINYSIGTIEIITIVAMIGYALLAWGVIGLVRLFQEARSE